MKTKEFLDNVCREIKYKPANRLISEELHGHIQDMKNEYLCKGYSEEVAEEVEEKIFYAQLDEKERIYSH